MTLIDLLLEDHQAVRTLFTEIATATGERRTELFDTLRENLVRHEVAEEEIVRPLTKSSVPDGERIAEERISEESKAEAILRQMEKAEVGSPEWERLFATLRTDVLEHAEMEETREFPQLQAHVPADQLEDRAKRFESAKKMAPTHPHPMTPNTPGANMTLGPLAALIDRVRDAIGKTRSA
jgi:hemerythrin superfamily protein